MVKVFVLDMKNSDLAFKAENDEETIEKFLERIKSGVGLFGLSPEHVYVDEMSEENFPAVSKVL